MSGDRVGSSFLAASALRSSRPSASGADHKLAIAHLLRSLGPLVRRVRKRGLGPRATAYQPIGEGLESKALLSELLGWTGGKGGISNSTITPANISGLAEQYDDAVDGVIEAEPLIATVNITKGPNPGIQRVIFVATQADSLYAFNLTTGQLDWQTNFLDPSVSSLPSVENFNGAGIWGTPVIDPSSNTIYLVSSESYVAGSVDHYTKTLRAIDMSDGAEIPGGPVVIADTGYLAGEPVSFSGPSVRGTGAAHIRGRDYFYVLEQLRRLD